MTLNFSQRSIFLGNMLEDNLVDPIWISNGGGYLVEGISENNVDVFGKAWHLNHEVEGHGRERCDRSGSQESVSKDIVDLLPSDPFGMDMSSTFTAITGWLEDLEAGYGGYMSNEVGVSSGDYQLFAGLNFICNNAMRFPAFQGNMLFDFQHNATSWHGGCSAKNEVGNLPFPIGFGSACNVEGLAGGYSSVKSVGDVSYHTVLRSACNVQCINSGYSYVEMGAGDVSCPISFGSARSMEDLTSGYSYPLEEKGVVDVSCSIDFGSACDMKGVTNGHCLEEKGVARVSYPVAFGAGWREETASGFGGCSEEKGIDDISFPVVLASACNMEDTSSGVSEERGVGGLSCSVGYMEDILSHGNGETDIAQYQTEECQEGCPESCGSAIEACLGETPRLALGLAMGYLGVRDLLSVESVCKYLRAMVRIEPYLWTTIHIDRPLNEKITDELLFQLTDRAQGELQCLTLLDCTMITDDGLMRVLESNPKLTKLSVPGCSKLTIEGIVNNLKSFKSMGAEGIKQLKIDALYGVDKYYEELKLLLGIDMNIPKKAHKPLLFHMRQFYRSCANNDDQALDIEMCPKCDKLRLIYDCSAGGCQRKERTSQACRACTLCIQRCFGCGRCIVDGEYEETFCLDLLCSFCKGNEDPGKSDCPNMLSIR